MALACCTLALVHCDTAQQQRASSPGSGAMAAEGATIEAVLDEPDRLRRAQRLAVLLQTIDDSQLPVAKRILMNEMSDPNLDLFEADLLAYYWARHEPEAAARWALFVSPPAYKVAVTEPTMTAWAKLDPEAAATQLQALATINSPNLQVAEKALVRGWYASGKPGLLEYIRNLGVGYSRQRALLVYAEELLRDEGVDAVRAWAEGIPEDEPKFKLAAYRQVATALGRHSFEAGTGWCDAHCEGPQGSNLMGLVAFETVKHDGPATMEWLSTKPALKHDRRNALRDAFSSWRRHDQEGLFAWIESVGPENVEPWLEPVIEVYGMALASEPDRAFVWADTLSDPKQREAVLIMVARRWLKDDPEAAEAWLATSGLSEQAIEKVREPVRLPKRAQQRLEIEQEARKVLEQDADAPDEGEGDSQEAGTPEAAAEEPGPEPSAG